LILLKHEKRLPTGGRFLNGVVDIIDNPGMYMVLPEKF
jgi:hypothetical protein